MHVSNVKVDKYWHTYAPMKPSPQSELAYLSPQKVALCLLCCPHPLYSNSLFIFFLLLSSISLYLYTSFHSYSHSSTDIWIVFRFLLLHMKTGMNISEHVFVWMYVFISLRYKARSGIAGSHGNSVFNI